MKNRANLKFQLKVVTKRIQDIEKQTIPYEKAAELILSQLFPQLSKNEINNWLYDVLYNDPKNTLKRMEKLFGEKS